MLYSLVELEKNKTAIRLRDARELAFRTFHPYVLIS